MNADNKAVTIKGICETCGEPIEIYVNILQPAAQMIYHDGCKHPTLTMLTHNPQKLGVITSD